MSASIDGVPWTAVCVGVLFVPNSDTASAFTVVIAGSDYPAGTSSIVRAMFLLSSADQTGSFPTTGGALRINSAQAPLGPGAGTMTFTTFTATNVAGTFSYSVGGKTVSDGRFNITFTR